MTKLADKINKNPTARCPDILTCVDSVKNKENTAFIHVNNVAHFFFRYTHHLFKQLKFKMFTAARARISLYDEGLTSDKKM